MKSKRLTYYFGLFTFPFCLTVVPASAEPVSTDRFGLYVVVENMDRATLFYEQLFGDPEIQLPSLVGFDVAGGFYAVVSREIYAADAIQGDTMRAYIKVSDIEDTFERVRAIAPNRLESAAVIVEGPFRFFRVSDPDDNVLEFFAIDAGVSQ
ncbi:VOC family protein [uncultured Sulfitobacter sp.]|uniref:VOC family protein n=1 Tax=uncultured Sulfitobacter sp. TaxID=191468 RepID=UPI00262895C0|nr:VOC family protein [uncultured Sulfitobacter sp.]